MFSPKAYKVAMLLPLLLIAACSTVPQLSPNAATIYVNENVGFAVAGFGYKQDGLVCDIDDYLVDALVERAVEYNIKLVRVKTASAQGPLLALDIESLTLGQNKRDYTGHSAVEPGLGVIAGLVVKGRNPEFTSTSHQCVAFSDQMVLTNSASGRSNCSSLQLCARRVSGDIAAWLAPQVQH